MANLKTWFVVLAVALFAASCGSKVTPKIGKTKKDLAAENNSKLLEGGLEGNVQLVDGTIVDLAKEEKPVILIFATEQCTSCRAEAKKFSSVFASRSGPPNLVRIITILAAAGQGTAAKWKADMGVSWEMGFDEKMELFGKYCSEGITPCLIMQNRKSNPKLKKMISAETEIATFEAFTGPLYGASTPQKEKLKGTLDLTVGGKVALDEIFDPILLLVAEEGNETSDSQNKKLVDFFTEKKSLPENVKLFSILTGSTPAQAKAYAEKQSIGWPIASDADGKLSAALCPEKKFPCIITQNMNRESSVQKKIGAELSIEQLQAETGEWKFKAPEQPAPLKLFGKVMGVDGLEIDLGTIQEPTVLIFSTFLCGSCQKEAKALGEYFKSKGGLPKNTKFITVLADRDLEGAKKFAEKWGISWTMAHDAKGALFQQVCPSNITPCVFTQNLKNTPAVIRRENQELNIDALEKETGPWQF